MGQQPGVETGGHMGIGTGDVYAASRCRVSQGQLAQTKSSLTVQESPQGKIPARRWPRGGSHKVGDQRWDFISYHGSSS
jgi:hypothetical protein